MEHQQMFTGKIILSLFSAVLAKTIIAVPVKIETFVYILS